MAFITKSNFARIISKIPSNEQLEGEVYKTQIHFFNKTERNRLLNIKEILKIGEVELLKIFVKIEAEDSQNWIFEGGKPACHFSMSCPTLNSEYINFAIPQEIKDKGEVKEFREWFKENISLLSNSDKQK